MSIGTKLRNLRNLRGFTMKELGLAVGFAPSSADVRIAQYEADTRVPKQDIIEKLADVLKVHPKFLATSELDITEDIIYALLCLDTDNTVRLQEEEYTTLQGEKQLETYLTELRLNRFLCEWSTIKKALQRGELTLEQYHEWRMNWPNKPAWLSKKE